MTVAELIKQLQALPQDMEVYAESDFEGGDYHVFGAAIKTDEFYGTGTHVVIRG